MKRSVRFGVLVFSWLMTLGARPAPPPQSAVPELPPSLVLQRYEEALA